MQRRDFPSERSSTGLCAGLSLRACAAFSVTVALVTAAPAQRCPAESAPGRAHGALVVWTASSAWSRSAFPRVGWLGLGAQRRSYCGQVPRFVPVGTDSVVWGLNDDLPGSQLGELNPGRASSLWAPLCNSSFGVVWGWSRKEEDRAVYAVTISQ